MEETYGRYVHVNGVRTHYYDVGSGPVVLLLHGSGPGVSAAANWSSSIEALGSQFRVLAPDIVGFGETESPEGQRYGVQYWLEHIIGLLDAVGVEKATFVGNSMGARVSLAAAVHYSRRVRKLVLLGSRGINGPLSEGLAAVREYQPGLENMRRLIREYFTYDKSFAADELVEQRYAASIAPGAQERYERVFADSKNNGLPVSDDELRGIEHHALIIHGREDRVIPFANGLRLFELIPNSQLHAFGRSGHWSQLENAESFIKLVSDFVQGED